VGIGVANQIAASRQSGMTGLHGLVRNRKVRTGHNVHISNLLHG
jgi:hypothetical protein